MAAPIRADKVEAEEVEWVWRDLIPRGMITIFAGKPDQGKGLAVAKVAADVSRTPMVNAKGKRRFGHVLYSAIEDAQGIMTRPRLEAAGANLANIDLWRFMLPESFLELEAHLTKGNVDLLVIDPLAAHLGNGVSRHSDNIRKVLNPLTELIEQTNTAVIIVEHVLKRVPTTGHPLAAIGGTGSGVVAAARMAFLFGTDPADDDHRVMCPVKHNIREKPLALSFQIDTTDVLVGENLIDVPMLMLNDPAEIEFDPMKMLATSRGHGSKALGRPADKRAAAAEWLTNYLFDTMVNKPKEYPVPAAKVFEDAKFYAMTSKTLRRAATDMEIVKNPPGGGPKCKWSLPQEVVDMLNGVEPDAPEEVAMPPEGEADLMDADAFSSLLDGAADVTTPGADIDAELAAMLGGDGVPEGDPDGDVDGIEDDEDGE